MLKLFDSTVKWLKNIAEQLKGSARRIFMAETVQQLGYNSFVHILRPEAGMTARFNFGL